MQSNDFKIFGGDEFRNYNFEKYKKNYIPEKYFLKTKNKKLQSNDFKFLEKIILKNKVTKFYYSLRVIK